MSSMGRFTDFNVWNRDLSENEMRDFTKCSKRMIGDLIPWNIDDWGPTPDVADDEITKETIDFDEMCDSKLVLISS